MTGCERLPNSADCIRKGLDAGQGGGFVFYDF